MVGRIPKSFIDDLLARADIVEVIDSRVKLKKAGRNYQACCPFHNEKSPSFSVSPEKQFYHCFGCGVHGNAISFLLEYEQIEFPEAVEELASLYGLEVPREETGRFRAPAVDKQQQHDDYELMEQIAKYFAHQLKHHSNGNTAIEYLKNRGLSGQVVKDFGIGFATTDWDGVAKTFGNDPSKQQQLMDLQLLRKKDRGGFYDFFRDRIMFPIHDKRGRTVGFGGRIIEGDGPKYLNSPETRIFHKGQELYGLYRAKKLNRKLEKVVIVEGYMDVVALAQYDINYAVASLGTATTSDHIHMLFRTTSHVVCCFDGDRAGREAAWRTLEVALPKLKDGYALGFLFLPDGEDPDSLVRKEGKEGFEQRLQNAHPLSAFLFEKLLNEYSVASTEGKAALISYAEPLIQQIEGEQLKTLLLSELYRKCGQTDIAEQIEQQRSGYVSHKSKKQDYKTPEKINQTPMRTLIKLLLDFPQLASETPSVNPQKLTTLNIKGHELFNQLHHLCCSHQHITFGQIFEHFRQSPYGKSIAKLSEQEFFFQQETAPQMYLDAYASLIQTSIFGRIDELTARADSLSTEEKLELKMLLLAKAQTK